MTGYWKCVDRFGTVAVAVVLATTVVPAPDPTLSQGVRLSAASTALIMGGTMTPTWHKADVDAIMNQFIMPTHPRPADQTIEPVAVTTPEEAWPLTGLFRLISLVTGPSSTYGPGGAGWPDEPWWKLTGLFDLTYDKSVQAGLADLEEAMAKYGNDHLVIYGFSQGAEIAILEKRKLDEQYPGETKHPDIDFVLSGDFNLPNGGAAARLPGFYVPILDFSFNGAEPTGTQFHTDVVTRQYDLVADFPLYPLNVLADLNAVLGFFYVHTHAFDVSLVPDLSTPQPVKSEHGDTTYYFFETQDLPLFGPLRSLGVPEGLIDIVEPFFRVLVELGYDRSIQPWEPTPARFAPPPLDLGKVATDLIGAIGEGINNAFALFAPPTPTPLPAAVAARSSKPAIVATDPAVVPVEKVAESADTADVGVVPEGAPVEPAGDSAGAVGTTTAAGATDPDVVPDVVSVDESADEVETTTIADVADAEEASAQQEPTAQDPGDPSTDDVPQDDAPNTLEDKADESPKAASQPDNPAPSSTPKSVATQDDSRDRVDQKG